MREWDMTPVKVMLDSRIPHIARADLPPYVVMQRRKPCDARSNADLVRKAGQHHYEIVIFLGKDAPTDQEVLGACRAAQHVGGGHCF